MSALKPDLIKKLWAAAKAARKNAYSPYSHYRVGAAVLGSDGKIYSGCNIENSSYGATVCAERVAAWNAFSAGAKSLKAVFVVTDEDPAWPPCGMCRQVLQELGGSSLWVIWANTKKISATEQLRNVLPFAHGIDHLLKNKRG